jgi:hypothetical protein
MTASNRTYGIEIECRLPASMSNQHARIAQAISAQGVDCRFETYNHSTRTWWKCTTDGSLLIPGGHSPDYAHGAEFVSPILHGEEGFRQVAIVMSVLQAHGVTTDKYCGLHVHVDAQHDDLKFHKTLAKFYGAYESVIDSIMPATRRGPMAGRGFCCTIAHASPLQIDATHSVSELFRLLGRGAGAPRYVKLNLARKYGTVEFRHHSGTLNSDKAINWIKTCQRMVEKAASGIVFEEAVAIAPRTPKVRRGSKRAICVELLLRPEGATREQLLAATGWPTISVQDVVSRTGMELLTTRMGRRITYRLNQAAAQAHSLSSAAAPAMEISIDGLCNMIGSPDDERQFLKRRAANLRDANQQAA